MAQSPNPAPEPRKGMPAVELDHWDYPRHLAGRVFAVVSHGDVEGAEGVRPSLADWLAFMHMIPAGRDAEVDRYIGYWEPYSTSHEALDADLAMQGEVRNAARALAEAAKARLAGTLSMPGEDVHEPRQK